MQLVIDGQGIVVKKRNKAFYLANKKQTRLISPHKLTSIAVLSDCLFSSAAIRLAAEHEIPIFFFNRISKVEAVLRGPAYGSIATIRRKQALFQNSVLATDWIISLFALKMDHQIKNLKKIKRRKKPLVDEIDEYIDRLEHYFLSFQDLKGKPLKSCENNILGIEGNIAKTYWEIVSKSLPENLKFESRSRRPAMDHFNAALNYLYGMLYSVVDTAVFAAGLDPYFGVLHADEYKKPTFTYDLIEPFRPWVDWLLIEQCLDNKIMPSFFKEKEPGYFLNKKGKQYIIPLFNDYMNTGRRFDHKQLTIKNHIHRFAGNFAQYLLSQENGV
jgi:CRISPR-associated protein Cas1